MVDDRAHVTQCRAHEEERGVGKCEQGQLPSNSAVRIAVVVELVHHYVVHVGGGTLA